MDLVSYFNRVNNLLYRNRQARMAARTYFGVNTAADQTAGLVGNDTKVASFLTMPIYERTNGSYTRLSYEVDFVPVGMTPRRSISSLVTGMSRRGGTGMPRLPSIG